MDEHTLDENMMDDEARAAIAGAAQGAALRSLKASPAWDSGALTLLKAEAMAEAIGVAVTVGLDKSVTQC